MSFEARLIQAERDEEYEGLKVERARLEILVGNWMDLAARLEADSTPQPDKDDIITQRDGFIAAVRLSLGI